jgi:CheY-like chemotaxis protein
VKPTSNATILIVEDNEDDIFFMQRAFKDAGLPNPLQIVTDGEEAIEYLDGRNKFADRDQFPFPAFIFLDLKLPLKDGFDVLQWIRNQKQMDLPVAVLTSSPEEKDMRRARELGASCYLIKPPTREMLLSCWRQFNIEG